MNWVERVRTKPQEQKIRLVWTGVVIAAVLMIVLWIVTARWNKNLPKDLTLFQTISRGITDIKNNFKK